MGLIKVVLISVNSAANSYCIILMLEVSNGRWYCHSLIPNVSFYNASKLAFLPKNWACLYRMSFGCVLGITDIYMTHFTAFYKISRNDVIHNFIKIFSLGDIDFTDAGQSDWKRTPKRIIYDLGYSRKFGKHFALGVAFRYIYSNLASGKTLVEPIRAGHAFGADLSGFI